MMKFLLLSALVATALCQGRFRPNFNFRNRNFFRPPPRQQTTGSVVDKTRDGSDYHYSWRHDGGRSYPWSSATSYCSRLGDGWQAVSIETKEEDSFITGVIASNRQPWLWTSGHRQGRSFEWASGSPFIGLGWSHTGGKRQPQPDNRERGGENCLAILNNFYGDGLKWHDVACHHEKPVICERKATK